MNKRKIIESTKQLMINRQNSVSSFVPYDSQEAVFGLDKSKSQYIKMLNGEWKFCYFSSFFYVEEEIFKKDYNITEWDKIDVPSNYEMNGYDIPQYINMNYPFPIDPPFVPDDNSSAVYSKNFFIPEYWNGKKVELHVEGVSSAAFIYINGEFVGYTTGSHNSASFDVTDLIDYNNCNRLTIETVKWCASSYLEDQDHFRLHGIFRDIYLVTRDKTHIQNIVINYNELSVNNVSILIKTNGNLDVNIKILDSHNNEIISINKNVDKIQNIALKIDKIKMWSDETPNLYTFIFNSGDEYIAIKYGFRTVKISDKGQLLINGKSVKIKGVNRHDTNPNTGYYCTYEDLKRDILMIKQNNFNCIRTSHYPNSVEFYDLCDMYGLYVIDEADIESHGMMWADDPNLLSNDKSYLNIFMDKFERMVKRDINHPSIIIWSLGNECGVGENQKELYNWVKKFDNTRLVHYEFESYLNQLNIINIAEKYKNSVSDFYGQMYPSTEKIREYGASGECIPMLLSEYCHSMGVGPGDIKDYWDLIYKYDNIVGGCIWEWCDHCIYTIRNGEKVLVYGGYFAEELNDGNFCADGLVTAERIPTSGLYEVKKALEPIKIHSKDINNGIFIIESLYNFNSTKDIVLKYVITVGGEIFSEGTVDIKVLDSHESSEFKLDYGLSGFETGTILIDIYVLCGIDTRIFKKGYEITRFQFELPNTIVIRKKINGKSNTVELANKHSEFIVKTQSLTYTFDRLYGSLKQINKNGTDILTKQMSINCWRAEIDNDRNISPMWKSLGLKNTFIKCYDFEVIDKSSQYILLKARVSLCHNSMAPIFVGTIIYTVLSNGQLTVDFKAEINHNITNIPCLAFQFAFSDKYNNISYFGRGPQESYADMKNYAFLGKYDSEVNKQYFSYIRPQENGNHTDTEYIELLSSDSRIRLTSNTKFDFSVLPYSMQELDEADYNYQLKKDGSTHLRICYKQAGVGSASCGPQLFSKYTVNEKYIDFNFSINIDE